MRYIEKDKITDVFSNGNLRKLRNYVNIQLSAQPDSLHPDYNGLNPVIRTDIINQLKLEQKGLCCYCLQRLVNSDTHIEHLAPQSAFLNEEVNYYNIFLSCGSNKYQKKHCGHYKKEYTIPKVISYFNPKTHIKCQDLFKYNLLGEILPSDGFNSIKMNYERYIDLNSHTKSLLATIDVLNLNCKELVSIRKGIIKGVVELPDDKAKLEKTLSLLETPNYNTGYLDPFCELTIFFLKDKIKKL